MSAEEAVARINQLLAHAWMVRTFLKHADEIQDNADMLEVPRTIFDYCRAVEPSAQRGDVQEFLHRARGKLSKLKKVSTYFAEHYRDVSDHTNFQMAARSLETVVQQLDELLTAARDTASAKPQADTSAPAKPA